MIDSRRLLRETGLRSIKTLTRWHQRGLIPEPVIGTHPNGRGKIAYWEDWVLSRCLKIRQLLREGHSLDEIEQSLGNDWEAEDHKWKRRYRFKEVSEQLDFQAGFHNFVDAIARQCRTIVRLDEERIERELSSQHAIERILGLLREGINPVVVLDGTEITITADFMVSHLLSHVTRVRSPLIVLPIFADAVQAFSHAIEGLPVKPSVVPVERVQLFSEGAVTECEVRRIGGLDFTLSGVGDNRSQPAS